MTAETLRFELSEYKSRLEKARGAMEKAGIDLLVVTDLANMAWLAGYDGNAFYVPQCVAVSKDKDPLWFGRGMDANGCRRTTYLAEDRIRSYEDHYVQSDALHPMTVLGQIIDEEGHGSSTIGVEKDNYYFSALSFEVLSAARPNAIFKNADRLINWQRIVKSEREIEYMRGAGKIIEAMYQRISEVLRPGAKQSDVVAELTLAGTRGVGEYWGDYPAAVPNIGAGADAAAPHLTWTDRPIRPEESIFFELAGVHKRYHCPLGQLARYGLVKTGRSRYSIGLGYPPAWGENTASFRNGDKTELRPGKTFLFMTGLWYGDWGIEITESILITQGQVEFLSNVPRKLFVID